MSQTAGGTPMLGRPDGEPHVRLLRYRAMVDQIHERVRATIPARATVLVVSKGDVELLRLEGCQGWHFPQDATGAYAGYYPAGDAAAIAHLAELRERGAQFLLLPATAFWWLDYYAGLRAYLDTTARRLWDDTTCVLFDLRSVEQVAAPQPLPLEQLTRRQLVRQVQDVARSLLPNGAIVLVASHGDEELLRLEGCQGWHFPQDATGAYAGYYPAGDAAAIAHLAELRERGAQFLLLPATAFWWLDYYAGLRAYLERETRLIVHQRHVCSMYMLQRDD